MRAILTGRIGGPTGRHGLPRSRWYDPVSICLLLAGLCWIILLARQVPCRPLPGDPFPNAYLRLCYTDFTSLWMNQGLSTGTAGYHNLGIEDSAGVVWLTLAAQALTKLTGHQVARELSFEDYLASSQAFLQIIGIILFGFFLLLVAVFLELGKGEQKTDKMAPARWQAAYIAISPVVFLAGIINWDLAGVALFALSLLLWQRKLPLFSGLVLAAAVSTTPYAVIGLLAIIMLAVRSGRFAATGRFSAGFLLTLLIIQLPLLISDSQAWTHYWESIFSQPVGMGSVWYIFKFFHVELRFQTAISGLAIILAWVWIFRTVLRAPRRPRLGQVLVLLALSLTCLMPGYSPQYALWLLPLVVLARPAFATVAIWTAGEMVYYFAVWGYLQGIIGVNTGAGWMYLVAILIRMATQIWVFMLVATDIRLPWWDVVREPLTDDPLGGDFDHSLDAPWVAKLVAANE